jgi:sarcosine oxidase subunit alpha
VNQVNRLPPPWGALLDRDKVVTFEFEGRLFTGIAGDNVASALAANGEWLLSRSFKYHRPRGVLTMAGQDANTLVQLPANPNALADQTPISDGLVVTGQNYRGSLSSDRNAWVGRFARFLPVGFYYHAFFRPRGIWNLWSRYFRRKAGLGTIDESYRAEGYDKQYLHCDVAVVGAGPAGLRAAIEAANGGANVLLIDESPLLGGSLNYARSGVDASAEVRHRRDLLEELAAASNVRVMNDAVVNGWYADNWLAVISGKRLYKLRAGRVVLAAGTMEQPALFRNNDLPGVMMGTAAQRLVKLYGVRPGQRAVVLAGNNDAYGVALDLLDAGVEVAAVVELRSRPADDERAAQVIASGVEVMPGHALHEAHGKDHVCAVDVRRISAPGSLEQVGRIIDCDLVCMSVGTMPAYQLACQAGASLSYDDSAATFSIARLPGGFELAGAVAGHAGPSTGDDHDAAWPIFKHPRGKEFVDLDEDLQIADIRDAVYAGYEHVQLVKRYSTCGMGPSQGRHSALATARLVARATGRTVAETGVTTARPPLAAETLAHCAGRSFYPASYSSMHHRHVEAGAQMLQAGAWYRPAYYGTPANMADCVHREVLQVRRSVGLIDVSTLGGIDIRGPDAAEFLNRVYTFAYAKQAPGTVRYALMTNEAGVVIDDGVACRLSDEHFYVTATTGGVERVFRAMLQWNARWQLDVSLANVTNAYCGINIAGPDSRTVLAKLVEDVDLGASAFGYLGVREGNVAGIPARILRVGFVGELGYEIHAPQHCGESLWDAVVEAGRAAGLQPVGIEAQRMLRLEKGHVIVGQDTDAMSNPLELQMGWAIARKKPYFVGGRSIRIHEQRPLERLLTGFCVDDVDAPLPKESHLVVDGKRMLGRVTSCGISPALGKTIGLAYVPPARAEPDSRFTIRCDNNVCVEARAVAIPFYDPNNERQAL